MEEKINMDQKGTEWQIIYGINLGEDRHKRCAFANTAI
jgi:hypothetical protein